MKIWPWYGRGKLGAGVEPHAQRRHVRAELARRRRELVAAPPGAELGIGQVAAVAVRVAEIQAGARRVIELVGRHVVAQQVAAVVGEPELAGARVPVETHAVADALGEHFEVAAVGVHARDLGVAPRIGLADVARRAGRHVQLAVRDRRPGTCRRGGSRRPACRSPRPAPAAGPGAARCRRSAGCGSPPRRRDCRPCRPRPSGSAGRWQWS